MFSDPDRNRVALGLPMSRLARLEWLARLGYMARGTVYLLVGWFALAAAFGGGRPEDTHGALGRVLQQPFGRILLGLIALGLVFYALWRAVQSALDLDDHGSDAKGIAVRIGLGFSALVHLGLAFFAASVALGWQGPGSGGDASKDWTAWLMGQPFGRWLVGAIGIAVIGVGIGHLVRAWKESYKKRLRADPDTMRLIGIVARIGLTARAIVFGLVGLFFLKAAWHADPSQSGGLGQALRTLQEQPYGPWLLALVAAGLFAFGTYSVIEGIYRRINSPAVVQRLAAKVA